MNLSPLQESIISNPAPKIVVCAASGSGKTRVLTEKVRQLLKTENPSDIAVITFTNMAANEMRIRLGEDYKSELFVGTIHSLANKMLLNAGISTYNIIDNEKFDEFFPLVRRHKECIIHYKWILLDEAQDTDAMQFEFLFKLINPSHYFIVGDPRQCIYQFRNCDPTLMMSLIDEDDAVECSLNENYRSSSKIIEFAKRTIRTTGLIDDSVVMRPSRGEVFFMKYNIVEIIKYINASSQYSNWAILNRFNNTIDPITKALNQAGIPTTTFKQGNLSVEELENLMAANTVKVLTIHAAKGLEWRNVVVLNGNTRTNDERNVSYVAITRARDNLIWTTTNNKPKTYNW